MNMDEKRNYIFPTIFIFVYICAVVKSKQLSTNLMQACKHSEH